MLLNSFSHRPLRSIVIHIARPGLTGFWTDPTLAVFAGITLRCGQLSNHHLGGNQWRVQTYWSRWSCQKMGGKEIKTKHELWQTEQSIEVSCKFFKAFSIWVCKYAKEAIDLLFYVNLNISRTLVVFWFEFKKFQMQFQNYIHPILE